MDTQMNGCHARWIQYWWMQQKKVKAKQNQENLMRQIEPTLTTWKGIEIDVLSHSSMAKITSKEFSSPM